MDGWQELVELESEDDVTGVDQKVYSHFVSFVVTISRGKRVPMKHPLTWSCPFQRFINARSSIFKSHPVLCASLTEYCQRNFPRHKLRGEEPQEVSGATAG